MFIIMLEIFSFANKKSCFLTTNVSTRHSSFHQGNKAMYEIYIYMIDVYIVLHIMGQCVVYMTSHSTTSCTINCSCWYSYASNNLAIQCLHLRPLGQADLVIMRFNTILIICSQDYINQILISFLAN